MKKILFDMKLIDRHYCFYLDSADDEVHAYAIKLDSFEGYHVTRPSEVQFLNKIIAKLSKKYIRRKDVLYKNEYYARYKNTYTGMCYFAKLENGEQIACPYETAKDLYDFYNTPTPDYAFGRKNKSRGRYSPSEFTPTDDWNSSSAFGNSTPYGKGNYYSPSDFQYGEFSQYGAEPTSQAPKKKTNMLVRVITVAGIVCFVTISAFGIKLLTDGKVINLTSKPTTEQSDTLQMEEDARKEIEATLNTTPNNDAETSLQTKYEGVEEQLIALGLEPWQIASELDKLSVFQGDQDDIAFYYDADNQDILYVFGENDLGLEISYTTDVPTSNTTIPAGVTRIMDAIAANPNLTEEEKATIIALNLDKWIEDYTYLSIDELVDRYSILDINYEECENGKEIDVAYTPYTASAGVYRHARTGSTVLQSEIILYNGGSLEESLEDDEAVLPHELNHVNGNLSAVSATLLNEGYNSLTAKDDDNRYKQEQLMAAMFIETFGAETMKEGFYTFNLADVLANKIAVASKRDYMDVIVEVEDLLEQVEEVLYITGDKGDLYKTDLLLLEDYKKIYETLGGYYSLMNDGKRITDNVITSVIMDYMTASETTGILEEGEHFAGIRYNPDGTFDFSVVSPEKDVAYDIGWQHVEGGEGRYSRSYVVTQDAKHDGIETYRRERIKDSDIDYLTR